jgi:hypothetical protein
MLNRASMPFGGPILPIPPYARLCPLQSTYGLSPVLGGIDPGRVKKRAYYTRSGMDRTVRLSSFGLMTARAQLPVQSLCNGHKSLLKRT